MQQRPVILGIRPEHISRDGANTNAAGGGLQARLSLPVELVEPTGAETHVVMRLGDREITARFAPSQAPKAGETVALTLDMSQACVFDAATELAIT